MKTKLTRSEQTPTPKSQDTDFIVVPIRYILTSFLLFFSITTSFSQEKRERTLYIIDSVAVVNTPDDDDELSKDDIDRLEVIINPERIKALGYEGKIDTIFFILTKAYVTRADDVKRIPTTKNMTRTNGQWYFKDHPYNGPFKDYFMNGKLKGEGTLKDGRVEGLRTVYYPNGNKRYFYTYVNGIENGLSEAYFINGKLKQRGSLVDKKEDGLWQLFYSTGKIKMESNIVNGKQTLSKENKKFFELLSRASSDMKEGNHTGAIKKLNEAIKLNADYADAYFYRGTAKLNIFDFDESVKDFDMALSLEPFYMEAVSNRAFARLRKFEFKDAKTLSKSSQITVLAAKDRVPIPKEELEKICSDLKRGFELGDRKPMIIDAIKSYCND
ncbi:tetratricopeptide repeat protein [Pedobacter nyackensis]|uniref:tetratricopeptide repeat protein n=1 Tax=Pedobacter nyackensis TaxID=475255 RepID=UPI00292F68C9|nr:tetratricopeptide repeat protein [Pedobacter nyackensis]